MLLSVLITIFSSNTLAQSNSDYLKSLEGGVSNTKQEGEAKPPPANVILPMETSPGSTLPAISPGDITGLVSGLSLEQFEATLRANYFGSYLFYKRLNNVQKNQVYRFYQTTPDPSKIRDKIMEVKK